MSITTLAQATINPLNSNQKQYLAFELDEEVSALLLLSELAGILNISHSEIVPMPEVAAWVLGLYNWRGEILGVIDLGGILELKPIRKDSLDSYSVLIIKVDKDYLGLAVHRINDIYWCNPAEIASAPTATIAEILLPILKGYISGTQGEIFWILDPNAIASLAVKNCL